MEECDLEAVIETLHMRGTNEEGEELPLSFTIPALAQYAGVSQRCARYAVDALRSEGRIDARVQRGQWTYKLRT
jgi:DNA-binding GntR family transcriptional regulator